jgi:hypothetical protein
LIQVNLPDVLDIGYKLRALVFVFSYLEKDYVYYVEGQGDSVDDLVGGHLSKNYLESALPEIEKHYRDVDHLDHQDQSVIVREVGQFALVLRLVL